MRWRSGCAASGSESRLQEGQSSQGWGGNGEGTAPSRSRLVGELGVVLGQRRVFARAWAVVCFPTPSGPWKIQAWWV